MNQASKRQFSMDEQRDPVDFFSWLANQLHSDLTGGKRKRRSGEAGAGAVRVAAEDAACASWPCSTRLPPAQLAPDICLPALRLPARPPAVLTDCLQGEREVTTLDDAPSAEAAHDAPGSSSAAGGGSGTTTQRVPFLMLSLDLPPAPLFKVGCTQWAGACVKRGGAWGGQGHAHVELHRPRAP